MTNAAPLHASFHLKTLDDNDLDQSFALATQVFVDGSTLHRALNIQLNEYRDYLWPSFKAMVSEGLSVVSVDSTTYKILGCLIITEFSHVNAPSGEKTTPFAPLSALTSELVSRYSRKRDLRRGEAVLVDIGAVALEASGKGIYKAMRKRANQVAHDHGFRFVLGELSSSATQRVVLTRMGHRKIAEVRFSDFEYEGSRPFASISDPESIVMSEGDLV
ncbi:hypothetical protein [Ruegeria conchae]|uniref:hypothetical protein n=1 Tax=Ruegeria conchae TaxID=981384 RepID=UPI0029C7D738|nr:hypothetical protein [Ruegeria conchae]